MAINLTPSKFKLTRLGRKLQLSDDQRAIVALPKDVLERTWVEILQKEDSDLFLFEIREQILEDALEICYEKYMEKQTRVFTAHCAAKAWLKLINWHFYRHDPGEDPSAYPPCYIPKRRESWIPDEVPEPSPKDTWGLQDLQITESSSDESVQQWSSTSSLKYPQIEEIPSEYWFPGKINLEEKKLKEIAQNMSGVWSMCKLQDSAVTESRSEELGTESEILQKVTDYAADEVSKVSSINALKTTTPINGSIQGAGDSQIPPVGNRRRRTLEKGKSLSGRMLKQLPPLDLSESRSRFSVISDCRLRNLRLDTNFEISSEKAETPPGEILKRK